MTNEAPDHYLRKAFADAGIALHHLEVTRYTPEAFGNLVADASTALGSVRIVYDRGFYVEASETAPDDPRIPQLIDALELAKRSAAT